MVYPRQNASIVLMIRPANFGFNPETAQNNAFQSFNKETQEADIKENAIREFDEMVRLLSEVGNVELIVLEDSEIPPKPDAVFPNNWFTTHHCGKILTWPMFSPLRRQERRKEVLDLLKKKFEVAEVLSFEQYEADNKFLEGTGSLVLDRVNRIAYACLSERTHPDVLAEFGRKMDYSVVAFQAVDEKHKPIYHTNVVMSVGDRFVIICLEAIPDMSEKEKLLQHFEATRKEVIDMSFEQLQSFAGNILQVLNKNSAYVIIISESGFHSLSPLQKEALARHGEIIVIPLNTIETYGGGSARCMLAEIFLPPLAKHPHKLS